MQCGGGGDLKDIGVRQSLWGLILPFQTWVPPVNFGPFGFSCFSNYKSNPQPMSSSSTSTLSLSLSLSSSKYSLSLFCLFNFPSSSFAFHCNYPLLTPHLLTYFLIFSSSQTLRFNTLPLISLKQTLKD